MRRKWSVLFRRRYGAAPLHLAGHLVALGLAGLALGRILSDGGIPQLLVLFLGIVIAHDLVFVPVYAAVDRLMRRVLVAPASSMHQRIPMINHVRAPLMVSAVLLLIYSPLISGVSDSYYFLLSAHHLENYLRNWLLLTAGLFLGSALIYAVRVVVRARWGAGYGGAPLAEAWPATGIAAPEQLPARSREEGRTE